MDSKGRQAPASSGSCSPISWRMASRNSGRTFTTGTFRRKHRIRSLRSLPPTGRRGSCLSPAWIPTQEKKNSEKGVLTCVHEDFCDTLFGWHCWLMGVFIAVQVEARGGRGGGVAVEAGGGGFSGGGGRGGGGGYSRSGAASTGSFGGSRSSGASSYSRGGAASSGLVSVAIVPLAPVVIPVVAPPAAGSWQAGRFARQQSRQRSANRSAISSTGRQSRRTSGQPPEYNRTARSDNRQADR